MSTLTTTTIPFTATAVEPIHHGAGTSGNTSLLRTQEVVGPDGQPYAVPFVSGNSLRHRLRTAAADHFLATVGAQPGSLSKNAVDLLFSGGALTKTGANINLNAIRDAQQKLPFLTLLGYSAASEMVAGKLYVGNLQLVCAENAWRVPEELRSTDQVGRRASTFRGEEFGTRHDVARTPAGRFTSLLEAVEASTTQMIYDLQVVKPGAVFYSQVRGVNLTAGEAGALQTALACATTVEDGSRYLTLGAKSAVGFGRCRVNFDAEVSEAYTAALAETGEEALELVEALVR